VDFDADGDTDVLSGSWPGDLYFFERNATGGFEPPTKILDADDKPLNAGRASTVFAVDWDADKDLDLVLGDIGGDVYVVTNGGKQGDHKYGEPRKLELGDLLKNRKGDSGPVVADWDSDGKNDLIVGFGDGSVVWFRNIGQSGEPEFDGGSQLVAESGFGFNFSKAKPGMWGARVKVCAVDWNNDGRMDLLLGDRSGKIVDLPKEETAEEVEESAKSKKETKTTRHGYVWVFLRST
jgi:hypothetical protein